MKSFCWCRRAGGLSATLVLLSSACLGGCTGRTEEGPVGSATGAQVPAVLDALTQPQFINPLPNPLDPGFVYQPVPPALWPAGVPADCDTYYEVEVHQIQQQLGLVDPVTGAPLTTTLWGYGTGPGYPASTFPGRTFVVHGDADGISNEKVCVQWRNELVDGGGDPLLHLLPIDATVHWAFSLPGYDYADYEANGVPIVPHVHGGHTESDSDGMPEYWWTPGESATGPRFVKSLYEYDNDQEAGTLWYHDHGLGITRLNVYAGLAGFYIVRDDVDTGMADNPLGLPAFPYEVPLVIQDRLFTTDGELYYPSAPPFAGAPDPSVAPEFFGDVMLVNSEAWPYLAVEPRQYRLRLLNGSDSRFYELWIDSGSLAGSGPVMTVIGTDDGLLYQPTPVTRLLMAPGERYDVVVDFSGWQGEVLVMRNGGRSPYPKGAAPNPRTEGRIMAFVVGNTVTVPDQPLPATLRTAPIQTTDLTPSLAGVPTHRLLLFEGTDQYGRLEPMLGVAEPTTDVMGNVVNGTLLWDDGLYPITENPALGEVSVWEVYNTTADAHPIHPHLVSFQLLDRQKFRGTITPKNLETREGGVSVGGTLSAVRLMGAPRGPSPEEAGWKDTVIMYPGQVTRVLARFDRPGRYVWHCHILSHEDNEMMRPYCVGDYATYCAP